MVSKIYEKFIDTLAKRLNELGKELEITEIAKNKISEEGYSPQYGARPLKRYIEKHIESIIAIELLKKPLQTKIKIDYKNEEYLVL